MKLFLKNFQERGKRFVNSVLESLKQGLVVLNPRFFMIFSAKVCLPGFLLGDRDFKYFLKEFKVFFQG